MRAVIRLLALRKSKQITEAQFNEFIELSKGEKDFDTDGEEYLIILKLNHELFDLPLDKLEHLFLAVRLSPRPNLD